MLIGCSLSWNSQLFGCLCLFLRQFSEETNLLFARRLPLIIGFECALEVSLDIDIERLRLQVRIRWIINTWNCLCRCQMVEIACQFGKLCAGALLLPLCLCLSRFLVVGVKIFTDFIVLSLNVMEVFLPGVEVMLILAAVESTVAKHRKIRL